MGLVRVQRSGIREFAGATGEMLVHDDEVRLYGGAQQSFYLMGGASMSQSITKQILFENSNRVMACDSKKHLKIPRHGELMAAIWANGAVNVGPNHATGGPEDAVLVTENRV